jgi:pyruvate dehydrogenase E2 component (dihydrolipoamide acetyltransferase)
MSWREKLLKHSTEKITYTDLLIKVVAAAIRRNPAVNASWQNETIIRKNAIHIGLAAALEDGLVVPVIHNADLLSVEQIAKARIDLVQRAHAGKLRPQDIENGTFTISNLGMYGVDAFSAIINSPQAGILAVGRISERVVPVKGQPSVQPMMTLSLSCDHRVLDGAHGAQFLETIADLIEEPAGLIQ